MLPPITLDSGSETPLYRQLFLQLRDSIQAGRLSHGDRLPATRELAGLLGLNRATVAAAYELLEQAGLLKGHVGRGTFVDAGVDAVPAAETSPPAPSLPPPIALNANGISFASSRPAAELFPMAEFRQTVAEVVGGPEAVSILQLGSPLGYAPLRSYLLEQQQGAAGRDVLITSGCQQALDLLQRVCLAPGDVVAVEDPVYPGLRGVFAVSRAKVAGIPVGANGVTADAVEAVLRRERPKLLVLTPNFQNPSGTTIPLEARERILAAVRASGVLLVENDIYGPLRYRGEALPTFRELDPSGDTVLLGSFSKIAFPGLRVGWVLARPALIERLAEAKQWCDLHSDQLSQAVLHRFAATGRLAAHRAHVQREGLLRLETALDGCARYLPPGTVFTKPDGGMSLWVKLPEPLDAGELLARAERANVNYLPGKYFAVSRVEPGGLRLSFAGLAPGRIREGLAILGDIFGSEYQRVRASRLREPAPALV